MSQSPQSLALIDPALLALLHGSFGKDGQLQPFVREIMLVECHIAGTSHRELKEVEPGPVARRAPAAQA